MQRHHHHQILKMNLETNGNIPNNKVEATTTFTEIQAAKCLSFDSSVACWTITNGVCWYTEWEWELRYIYVQ